MTKINDFTPEQKEILSVLWPTIESLVRKVNSAGDDLCLTGFIYGGPPGHPMFVHIGNIIDRGENLVRIHSTLALMAAEIDATGLAERTEILPAPEGSTPEEIADKLALMLLQTPPGEGSDQIQAVLKQYLAARAPKKS